MITEMMFIDRRKGGDRRSDADPCKNMPLDLFHRKRRKSRERRAERSLSEDYYAYTQAQFTSTPIAAQHTPDGPAH